MRWPKMKLRRIRLRVGGGDVQVQPDVLIDGTPVVSLYTHNEYLTPAEAERVAKALLKAADVTRRRQAYAKKRAAEKRTR